MWPFADPYQNAAAASGFAPQPESWADRAGSVFQTTDALEALWST